MCMFLCVLACVTACARLCDLEHALSQLSSGRRTKTAMPVPLHAPCSIDRPASAALLHNQRVRHEEHVPCSSDGGSEE